jgi:hypothetical protein
MNTRLACLLFVMCGLAHASDEAQLDEIKRRREVIEAEHTQREQACRKQFAVTSCLEKALARKQEALQSVRTQERALDDVQRRQRAQAQAQRLADKASAAQAGVDKPAVAPEGVPQRAATPKPAKPPSPTASVPDRRAIERRKREDFEARQREIQAHREAVAKRNAERAARKPAKPLPVPASAAVP